MSSHTIDATNNSLGRIASQAAHLLMGKNAASFRRNKAGEELVTITNASRLFITAKKLNDKKYISYTGYPGGLKQASMEAVRTKKGISHIIRKAVKGMLPKNRLQIERLKRLTIKE